MNIQMQISGVEPSRRLQSAYIKEFFHCGPTNKQRNSSCLCGRGCVKTSKRAPKVWHVVNVGQDNPPPSLNLKLLECSWWMVCKDLTFWDQNGWFYSYPESTIWMFCVFFWMAIPILTTRINKVGPRIGKGGPRINEGGPRINKVGKPETTNRVARPICSMVQTPNMNVNLINQWELS